MPTTRQQTAYKVPTLGDVTAKLFQSAEHLKTLVKNELTFPANTYDDVDKYGFVPSDLFWDEASLYYSNRQFVQPAYVQEFLTVDLKAPLRGSFKRTEIGTIFAEELKKSDLPSPGDAMTTPKQFYVPTYQDKSRPIEDIHLRSLVDDHLFDFVQHFNNHEEYFKVNQMMYAAINKSIARVERLLVDAFLMATFGGHLHCYPVGSPLYRFFGDPNGWVPDDEFSKQAKAFYDKDGEIAKTVKEISGWAAKTFTSKKAYLTTVVQPEIPQSKQADTDVPKFSNELLPDFSTKEKALETARNGYLKKEPNEDKWKKLPNMLRRPCLMAFVSSLTNIINRMQNEDVRNHAAYDHYADNTEKVYPELASLPSQLMVFMNYGDYVDLKNGLIGSPASGMFTERPNGELYDLMQQGLRIYGLPFIMPGCAIVIDRLAFTLKEYYSLDAEEGRPYHLVKSRIKHVKKKPVMYEHVVFEAICPAKGQKFVPEAGGSSENLPLLVKDA